MKTVRHLGCGIHVNRDPTGEGHELFVYFFIYDRIQRMAGAEQDGIHMLVEIEMILVERDLPVGGIGVFPEGLAVGSSFDLELVNIKSTYQSERRLLRGGGGPLGRVLPADVRGCVGWHGWAGSGGHVRG